MPGSLMQRPASSNDKHYWGVISVLVPQEREQYGKLVELSKAQSAQHAVQVPPCLALAVIHTVLCMACQLCSLAGDFEACTRRL